MKSGPPWRWCSRQWSALSRAPPPDPTSPCRRRCPPVWSLRSQAATKMAQVIHRVIYDFVVWCCLFYCFVLVFSHKNCRKTRVPAYSSCLLYTCFVIVIVACMSQSSMTTFWMVEDPHRIAEKSFWTSCHLMSSCPTKQSTATMCIKKIHLQSFATKNIPKFARAHFCSWPSLHLLHSKQASTMQPTPMWSPTLNFVTLPGHWRRGTPNKTSVEKRHTISCRLSQMLNIHEHLKYFVSIARSRISRWIWLYFFGGGSVLWLRIGWTNHFSTKVRCEPRVFQESLE